MLMLMQNIDPIPDLWYDVVEYATTWAEGGWSMY